MVESPHYQSLLFLQLHTRRLAECTMTQIEIKIKKLLVFESKAETKLLLSAIQVCWDKNGVSMSGNMSTNSANNGEGLKLVRRSSLQRRLNPRELEPFETKLPPMYSANLSDILQVEVVVYLKSDCYIITLVTSWEASVVQRYPKKWPKRLFQFSLCTDNCSPVMVSNPN